MEEKVVDWKEGEWYRIDVYERHKIPMITSMFGEMKVQSLPDGNSTLAMTFEYEVGAGPIGWLMNKLMMRSQFTKSVKRAVAGFKHRIETGEAVHANTTLETSSVTTNA